MRNAYSYLTKHCDLYSLVMKTMQICIELFCKTGRNKNA